MPARLGAWCACLGLALALTACVAKPEFHCQSDDSCVASDGSKGTCQASGECKFQLAVDPAGGSGGGGASMAGSGGTGHVGMAGTASSGGIAGAGESSPEAGAAGTSEGSCENPAAGNCYACAPKTSAQFLNACTSSACVPFDDTRLTKLTASGDLPPLPSIPAP